MTGESKGKLVSRFVAVLFMGLAFVAGAAMLSQGDRPLFTETPTYTADAH
jgi:hypothetical protein